MELTRKFEKLNKGDANIAGGKGASLGEMAQAGIPVPDGFVVLSTTFDKFLHETDLTQEIETILKNVDHKAIHTVEAASEKIKELIEKQEVPQDIAEDILNNFKSLNSEFVAVRSSATAEDGAEHAWAGQLDSFLNTTETNLLENVRKCWSSLFTPRAIFYRFEKQLHGTEISVAVVVQKMVQSEVSGISFSVHPITEDPNQIIIEAGFGLGEAIVSGSITPDSYVVEKTPSSSAKATAGQGKIIDINVNTQTRSLIRANKGGNEWVDVPEPKASSQVLTESQILELAKLIIKIETHYSFPCDIEWAYENGKFYIVQSRPITTLSNQNTSAVATDKKEVTDQKVDHSANYDPNDYVRMFAGKSLIYLITEIFLGHYGPHGVLSIQDVETWMSFLPKVTKEKTLLEGKELYTSKEKYNRYKKEFDDYIKSSSEYFESIINKDNWTEEELRKFFELASKHFHYYSQTEFFYTDLLKPEEMVISVQEFDKLKLGGRSYLNKIFFEESGYVRRLIKKISDKTEVSEKYLMNHSIDEIIGLVINAKKVEEEKVQKRDTFFSSHTLTLVWEEARHLIEKFFTPYREVSDIIHGTIANKGKVRGKARVMVPNFADFDRTKHMVEEMQEGEILVVETTAPEIIQACHKAIAIVANQGGMLSHAAIISRELNIPCIIGTDKEVTLNIKTGDDIEVDADEGVVRILR